MNNVQDNTNPVNPNPNQNPKIYRQVFRGTSQSPVASPPYSGFYSNQPQYQSSILPSNLAQQTNVNQGQQIIPSPVLSQNQSNNQWPTGRRGTNMYQNLIDYNGQMRRQNDLGNYLAHQPYFSLQEGIVRERTHNLRQIEMDHLVGINNNAERARENSLRRENVESRSVFAQSNGQILRNQSSSGGSDILGVGVSSVRLGKMDGIYAQSFKSLKYQHIALALIGLVILIPLLLLYKFKAFKGVAGHQFGFDQEQPHLKFSIIPFLIFVQSIMFFSQLYYILSAYFSLVFALQTAQQINCASVQEPANLNASFNQNVSNLILSAQTPIYYSQEIDYPRKKILIQQTQRKIERNIRDKFCCFHQVIEICSFAMFICSIVTIIALAQGNTTWLQKLILISTIVYWMLRNYRKFYYLGIMLICPLLTIAVIFYLCFCQDKKRKIQIPNARHPSQFQILNSGGTCSICMMEFETSDNAVTLPCSDKHMFHQLCINGWLSLKTSCPICRFDLAQ